MSSLNWGDIPTWFAAVGTIGAVGAAFRIAHTGTEQNKSDRSDDRKDAEKRLHDEREIARKNLSDERSRAFRQRHSDHMTRLLLEVYDLYADYESTKSKQTLYKLHPRLAVLPNAIAVSIRIAIGDTSASTENSRNKAAWLKHRLGRTELKQGEIGWDVVSREAEFDLWWVREANPPSLANRPWHELEMLEAPDGD